MVLFRKIRNVKSLFICTFSILFWISYYTVGFLVLLMVRDIFSPQFISIIDGLTRHPISPFLHTSRLS